MTTWYLSYTNGAGGNNGTSSATPKKIGSDLTLANGDTVKFLEGDYWPDGTGEITSATGKTGLTFTTYPPASPSALLDSRPVFDLTTLVEVGEMFQPDAALWPDVWAIKRASPDTYASYRAIFEGTDADIRNCTQLRQMNSTYAPTFTSGLVGAIDDTQTTITGGGVVGTSFAAAGYAVIGSSNLTNFEIVKYTGKTGNQLTGCTRGALGTTARAFASGVTLTDMTPVGTALQASAVGGFATMLGGNSIWTTGTETVTLFKASDGSDPTSNGKVYKASYRGRFISSVGSGFFGSNFRCFGAAGHNGAVSLNTASVLYNVELSGGVGHNFVGGASVYSCQFKQFPHNTGNVVFLHTPGSMTARSDMKDCIVDGGFSGVLCHGNTFGLMAIRDTVFNNCGTAIDFGVVWKSLAYRVRALNVLDSGLGVFLWSGAFAQPSGSVGPSVSEVIDCYCQAANSTTGGGQLLGSSSLQAGSMIRVWGLRAYGFSGLLRHGNVPVGLSTVDVKHLTFANPDRTSDIYFMSNGYNFATARTKVSRSVIQLHPNVAGGYLFSFADAAACVSDYNLFGKYQTFTRGNPGYVSYATLAAWTAATGQDAHSLVGKSEVVYNSTLQSLQVAGPDAWSLRAGADFYEDDIPEINDALAKWQIPGHWWSRPVGTL